MCRYQNSTWLYRNTDIGQVTVRHGSTLRLAMVLPLVRGTDKTGGENQKGRNCEGPKDKTVDHLRLKMDSEELFGPIWGLGFEEGDDVAKMGWNWTGGEFVTILLWETDLRGFY